MRAECHLSEPGDRWRLDNRAEMTPEELDDFAARYFHDWAVLRSGSRDERVALEQERERPSDILIGLMDDPTTLDEAWAIVVDLVDQAPDDEALAFVAAGPLEELIRRHSQQCGDQILDQARRDRRFRQALGGVWGWEDVAEPLRRRLQELVIPFP
jgi:hypothetical protein